MSPRTHSAGGDWADRSRRGAPATARCGGREVDAGAGSSGRDRFSPRKNDAKQNVSRVAYAPNLGSAHILEAPL